MAKRKMTKDMSARERYENGGIGFSVVLQCYRDGWKVSVIGTRSLKEAAGIKANLKMEDLGMGLNFIQGLRDLVEGDLDLLDNKAEMKKKGERKPGKY